MKYLSLELRGYNNLAVNDIRRIVYKPTAKIQLILGSNGSGKSSLLRELTPLPAIRGDYAADGFKQIQIEHNDHIYVLTTDFGSGHTHSFKIDGEAELNDGGTITIQKELVKTHFNIDTDVRDLLISHSSLSRMGPGDRKKWFTRLSDVNYHYAMNVYIRIKGNLRDITGALKLARVRLVVQTEQLLSPEDEEVLRRKVSEQQSLIGQLMEAKKPLTLTEEELLSKLDSIQIKLKTNSQEIISDSYAVSVGDMSQIDIIIAEAIVAYQNAEKLIEQIASEHETISQALEQLNRTTSDKHTDLDGQIKELSERINSLVKGFVYAKDLERPESVLRALETTSESWLYVFNTLASNENKIYSKSNFIRLKDELEATKKQINLYQNKLCVIEGEIKKQEHYKNHDATTCPECNHTWHIGFKSEYYDRLLQEQLVFIETIEKFKVKESNIENELVQIKEYVDVYKHYTQLVDTWPILNHFNNHLTRLEIIINNPRRGTYLLQEYQQEVVGMLEVERLQKELDELRELKKILSSDTLNSIESLNLHHEELDKKLHLAINDRDIQKKKMEAYKVFKLKINGIQETVRETHLLLAEHHELIKQLVNFQETHMLNEIIQAVRLELSAHERALGEVVTKRALIKDLEEQIQSYEQEEITLKHLLDALSPTDGLIAKGMLGFIHNFIQQMNSLIKKIWSYPLELQACHNAEEDDMELDYKFPVRVKDQPKAIKDVGVISTGMQEIVDLAFKIVCMKYLNLQNGALYLDEFGKTFDAVHRRASMDVIANIMAQSSFSQLFVISHYSDSYGGLANTDINVLCDKNIVLPSGCLYNEALEIEYI